jgi:hypothetical protein
VDLFIAEEACLRERQERRTGKRRGDSVDVYKIITADTGQIVPSIERDDHLGRSGSKRMGANLRAIELFGIHGR